MKSKYTTGLEIEALTAVSTSSITVFDMLKSYKKEIIIQNIQIIKKEAGKITLDDIFNAIRLIEKYLPKPTYTLKKIKSLTSKDLINDRFTLKDDIPPYNQSAMDGIGVISKKDTYILKGKTLLNKYIDYKIKDNECVIVKTGSLIPNSIKYIIPCEVYFQNKNLFHIFKYDFKILL